MQITDDIFKSQAKILEVKNNQRGFDLIPGSVGSLKKSNVFLIIMFPAFKCTQSKVVKFKEGFKMKRKKNSDVWIEVISVQTV